MNSAFLNIQSPAVPWWVTRGSHRSKMLTPTETRAFSVMGLVQNVSVASGRHVLCPVTWSLHGTPIPVSPEEPQHRLLTALVAVIVIGQIAPSPGDPWLDMKM